MKMIDWLTTKILPGWVIIAALFGTGVWYSSAAWKRLQTLEENLATLTKQVESNRHFLDAKIDASFNKLDAKIDAKFDKLIDILLTQRNAEPGADE